MRILWITNIIFPEAEQLLKGEQVCFNTSGGWLLSSAISLIQSNTVELSVATVSSQVVELFCAKGESGIIYYLIPFGKGNYQVNNEYEKYWKEILASFKPDIIHIHGTEFSHGLACLNVCGETKTVVSIQGVMKDVSVCYGGGISKWTVLKNITVHDVLRGTGIWTQSRNFHQRAEIERIMLNKVKYVMGRTSYDKRSAISINSGLVYFKVNETLRDVFYQEPIWEYSKCIRHRIFFSQSFYPLKGLHIFLQALPFVLNKYPDTTVHVAGSNITRVDNWRDRFKITGYGKILRSIIDKNNLDNVIQFTGALDADGMKKEYLDANVFVCSSMNENSSNSICEAQILGVPCIASNVGGNPDLVEHTNGWLYDFDNTKLLAKKICDVFEMEDGLSCEQTVWYARQRHDRMKNMTDLLNAYHSIIQN